MSELSFQDGFGSRRRRTYECFPVQKVKVEVFEQVYGVVDGVNPGVVRAERIADPLGMFAVVAEAVVKGLVCAMAVGGAGNNGEADLCQGLQHFEEYLSDGFRSVCNTISAVPVEASASQLYRTGSVNLVHCEVNKCFPRIQLADSHL